MGGPAGATGGGPGGQTPVGRRHVASGGGPGTGPGGPPETGGQSAPGSGQGQTGSRQGSAPNQAPEGLRYGGEAEHGHAPTHVGSARNIGQPTEQRGQPRTGGETPVDWAERHRDLPRGRGEREQYGHEHRHGEADENWTLGEPPDANGGGNR